MDRCSKAIETSKNLSDLANHTKFLRTLRSTHLSRALADLRAKEDFELLNALQEVYHLLTNVLLLI